MITAILTDLVLIWPWGCNGLGQRTVFTLFSSNKFKFIFSVKEDGGWVSWMKQRFSLHTSTEAAAWHAWFRDSCCLLLVHGYTAAAAAAAAGASCEQVFSSWESFGASRGFIRRHLFTEI